MTPVRLSRWIILLGAFFACVTWSYIAIDHLLNYSMSQQERVSQYSLTPRQPSPHLHQVDVAQRYWSQQSLFAVACSFAFLLAVMMNWVLDGRPRRGGELK